RKGRLTQTQTDESLNCDEIICGKFLTCLVASAPNRSKPQPSRLLRLENPAKLAPKMKDPSGGTTGRVKPYGRLGWMGARAEYSHGEGFPLPQILVAGGLLHVQSGNHFF